MKKSKVYAALILALFALSMSPFTLKIGPVKGQEDTTMFVAPPSIINPDLQPSNNFTVMINITGAANLFTWQIKLLFDPSIIECAAAEYPPGHIFDGETVIPVAPEIDNIEGSVLFGSSLLLAPIDVPDGGVLCELTFHVLDTGSSELILEDSFLLDGDLVDIPIILEDGFFANLIEEEEHDVAVVDVLPSSASVIVGSTVTIDVTVENIGDFAETVNVTAYYDVSEIGTMYDVALGVGEDDTVSIPWNTSGVSLGSYVISATVSVVEGEVNTDDNFLEDGTVEVVEEAQLIHDVAVVDVLPSSASVIVGSTVTIDVTVENIGDFAETVNVTAYYDAIEIATVHDVALGVSEDDTVSIPWNTSGVSLGSYVISATVSVVEGEVNTDDNSMTDGTVQVVEETPLIHDVAVVDVLLSSASVIVGDTVTIDVTVENIGDFAETVNVTAYYDAIEVDTVYGVSLGVGEDDTVSIPWDTSGVSAGSYVISATVSVVEGEVNTDDNSMTDGTVEVTEEMPPPPVPLPPPEGPIRVHWCDYPTIDYPCGDPKYPFGGVYHNGQYPVWKNFTVTNNADEGEIKYIALQYPEADPTFKPSRCIIELILPYDPAWTININLDDRLIEFIAESEGIPPGGCAIVSVEFKDGPTEEDCYVGHEFHVTATLSQHTGAFSRTFQHTVEYIDKTPPNVDITFPDATTPGGQGYAFKKEGGYIWVQTPDCTVENIEWLWINGTANDFCSGINRVEIWINGTYMGDATLSETVGAGKARNVEWWWYIDPTNDPTFWEEESWFYVVARAYDNSVNNAETVNHGGLTIPKTHSSDTVEHWFFWIGENGPVVEVEQDWIPGNGLVDISGLTGFYPNGLIELYLINELYDTEIFLKNVTANNYGRFETTLRLPEVPRKPICDEHWLIKAIDIKGNEGADHFAIIPWITYEDTMRLADLSTWQTTMNGNVGDTIMIYGHGFLPSRHPEWNPHCTVYVRIYYTDAGSLEEWDYRRIFNGTSQFNLDTLAWYPKLETMLLAEVTTDVNGYWSAQITIPQSFGGLHAIYACEDRMVADPTYTCPNGELNLVCSGWSECTGTYDDSLLGKMQAAIFDVWPTLEVSPSTAITDSYVTVKAEGLPLPRYYELQKNDETIITDRDWCLVLDFGSYTEWVFENKRLRNNELDLPWVMEEWYPFAYYTPDPASFPDSPVWRGKLTSITKDYAEDLLQFHIGSKFLKVPVLPPSEYEVTVYYFDKLTQSFDHEREASTTVNVLKDPLHIDVDVAGFHFPGETVDVAIQVDVDGIITDATTLELQLYKGNVLLQTLSYEQISMGFYTASFTCPIEEGDYVVKASVTKEYEAFTLYSTAMSAFTVNPTLNALNAKLVELDGKVATVLTDMGEMKVDLAEINGKVVEIEGQIATIETDIGSLETEVTNINAKVVSIEGTLVTIETDVGLLQQDAEELNAKITGLQEDFVVIHTELGELTATLGDVNGLVHIQNDVATIKTELGQVKGKVQSLEGDVTTIKTDIGTIAVQTSSIRSDVGLQPVAIGLSLIAALAAIVAAALILRKVYIQ
ncbi:MAG: hypothetical protein PVF96_02485 [Candidatus Bathyarchaeota archaeon]